MALKMAEPIKLNPREETPPVPASASPYIKGENKSGLHPLGRAVLLWPLEQGLKSDRIQLLEESKARNLALDTEAYVVEMGPNCVTDEGGIRCKVGDRVVLAAMSGSMRKGRDGRTYRICNHRDIYCLVDDEEVAK